MSRSRFDPDPRLNRWPSGVDEAFARALAFLQRCRLEHWLMFAAGLFVGAILI